MVCTRRRNGWRHHLLRCSTRLHCGTAFLTPRYRSWAEHRAYCSGARHCTRRAPSLSMDVYVFTHTSFVCTHYMPLCTRHGCCGLLHRSPFLFARRADACRTHRGAQRTHAHWMRDFSDLLLHFALSRSYRVAARGYHRYRARVMRAHNLGYRAVTPHQRGLFSERADAAAVWLNADLTFSCAIAHRARADRYAAPVYLKHNALDLSHIIWTIAFICLCHCHLF